MAKIAKMDSVSVNMGMIALMQRVTILLICMLVYGSPADISAARKLRFEHITSSDGLSQNSIFCVLQDRKGFLWLGTEDGLNRYDGYEIKIYKHEPDNLYSLSNSRVISIAEDQNGRLWIGTESGVNVYDPQDETFTSYKLPGNEQGEIEKNEVNCISVDRESNVWVGAEKGLFLFDRDTRSFKWLFREEDDEKSFPKVLVEHIYEDSKRVLWIATAKGIFVYDTKNNRSNQYNIGAVAEDGFKEIKVNAIYEDFNGKLWIGTEDGKLYYFDPVADAFTEFKPPALKINKPKVHAIQVIYSDPDFPGILWVGTDGGGLFLVNIETGHVDPYFNRANDHESLSNNFICSMVKDTAGVMWIGTEGGLNKFNPRKGVFAHWKQAVDIKNSLSNSWVWCVQKDRGGVFWVGTNKGLNRFDRKSGKFAHFVHNAEDPGSLSHDRVRALLVDHKGTLWVGTEGGGLNVLDRGSETFTHYRKDEANPGTSLSDDRISSIFEDKQGRVWLGTDYTGISRFNRDTGRFAHFRPGKEENGELNAQSISLIYQDRRGYIWVGTHGGGLNRLAPGKETFEYFKNDPKNIESISGNYISTIYEGTEGSLWIGTYGGGLNRFDYQNEKFKQYRKAENVDISTVNGILGDKHGNLWISTNKGISKFTPGPNRIINFDVNDGLQGNEFNGNACFWDPADGRMYFGGGNGLTVFLPDDIVPNPVPPLIVLTDLKIFDKSVRIGEEKDGVVVLKNSIAVTGAIELSYRHSVFTLEYAGLHFVSPARNKYRFMMENLEKDWNEAGNRRNATYVHVPPGEYIFKVQASNGDGTWTKAASQLKIVIIPPFTQTWWFRGIVLGVFALLLLGGHRYRTRLLRNKLAEQTRVQKILKESRDEMQRSRDLAELRSAENELLLTAISSVIIAVDSNGEIFQWNEAAESFFGITPEKAAKRTFIDMLGDCIPREYLEEIMIKGLEQGQSSKEIEFAVDLKCRGQGIKMLLSSINPIIDREGKKLGFLLLAEDISNRREEEMQENLSRKLESLGQLASGIAHEIKTPLQYIGHNATFVSDSFSEVNRFFNTVNDLIPEVDRSGSHEEADRLRHSVVDFDMEYIMDEIPRASEQIINGVNRVSNIIRALNEFSYPGRGYKERCNLNALLKSTMVVVQNRIKKVAEMKLELSDDLPPVPCYPGELNQVFLNILVNAADAVAESGKWGLIRVATRIEGAEIVIEIADSGCGIPEENKESIFNPFFTTKEVGKGTGQGLALVHNVIIDKHNGKLDFTSKVGVGTTFYIRLPIEGGD